MFQRKFGTGLLSNTVWEPRRLIIGATATMNIWKLISVIPIIQPTRCNSFTSLLLDVYVWLNMFRASPRPSSGAYNCTRSLWFYRWGEAAGALLVMVWQVINLPDHDQKLFSCFSPTVKPEAPSAVVCSWWWAGRRPKHVEPHINVK